MPATETPPPPVQEPTAKEAVADAFTKMRQSKTTPAPPAAAPEPTPTPVVTPEPTPTPKPTDATSRQIPSFISTAAPEPDPNAVKPTAAADAPAATDDDPLPASEIEKITDPKKKADLIKFRAKYDERGEKLTAAENELSELREKSKTPPKELTDRIAALESQQAQADKIIQLVSVENSPRYQREIGIPLKGTTDAARKIVADAGGNPDLLDSALALKGQEHYQALETLYKDLPEPAKIELGGMVTQIKRLLTIKENVIANAPEIAKQIHEDNIKEQTQFLAEQRKQTEGVFDGVVKELRDVHKLEVLTRSNDPKESWWNEQADQIEATAKDMLLNNTDMRKYAATVVLGCAADVFRTMFLTANARALKAEKEIADIRGSSPNLRDEGGGASSGKAASDSPAPAKAGYGAGVLARLRKGQS